MFPIRFKLAITVLGAGFMVAACGPDSLPGEDFPGESVTLNDYERAEQFLAVNTSKLMQNNILA